MSTSEERLFDLVDAWEMAFKEGKSVSPEELCSDCPELIPKLTLLIQALAGTAWMEMSDEIESEPELFTLKQVGRYQLQERIGSGGFAEVWKAYDPQLERYVAIKIPKDKVSFHTENFLEEARKIAKLRHPGIVAVFDVGQYDNQWFIVSELIEAGSLADRIQSRPLSHAEAIQIVADIGEALHHAHQQGFIHRDMKPQNILIDENGKPKITDFGIALSETQKVAQRLRTAGTMTYMSPEQVYNRTRQIDARTDIYSLGVVLYQLLTGRLPFHSDDRMELWSMIDTQAPRTPRTIDRSIPIPLERLCLKALSKDPQDRFSTAHDMADELRLLFIPRKPILQRTAVLLLIFCVLFGSVSGAALWWWKGWIERSRQEVAEQTRKSTQHAASVLGKVTHALADTKREMVGNIQQHIDDIPDNPNGATDPTDQIARRELAKVQKTIKDLPELPGKATTKQAASADLAAQLGIKALNAGNQSTALAEFNKAIQINDRQAAAWHGRGVIRFNQGNYPQAVTDLKRAVSLDSHRPEYFKNLAFALVKTGDHDEAVREILRGFDQTNPVERSHYHRVVAQIYDARSAHSSKNGDHQSALADLSESIKWDETYSDAYDDRGSTYFNIKNYLKAVDDFNTAIKLNPNRPEFYVHRGHALKALGRHAEGQSDYETARRLEQANGK